MPDGLPIELEALEALAAREREEHPLTVAYPAGARTLDDGTDAGGYLVPPLARVIPIRLPYVPPVVVDLAPPPTLPDVVAAVDQLADELLAVDLELGSWRTDVERAIR